MRDINWVGMLVAVATGIAFLNTPARAAEDEANGAPTPGDAMVRMAQAMADGDEAALRNVVVYRKPSAYAESQTRSQMAAARLHRAVREHGVTSKRVRDAGFDRNERLIANAPPSGKELEQALAAYRAIQWEIDGDVARMAPPPAADGQKRPPPPNPIRVERLPGRGWVVVVSDAGTPAGDKPDDEELKPYLESARISAEVFEAATAKVKAGELKTVLAVNEFISAERDAIAERAVAAMRAAPPSGPVIVVTDADTGKPVAGATVSGRFTVPPGKVRRLSATTDDAGRARLPAEPDSIHELGVSADGYARRHKLLPAGGKPAADGQPAEHHVTVGKPAVMEITLEFPDDRRAALSVYEGSAADPSPAALREQLAAAGPRVVRVEWKDEPPPLPKHHPMLVMNLHQSEKGKTDPDGVSYRVTRARDLLPNF